VKLSRRYRQFKSRNRYNYPLLFACIGLARTIMQFCAVAIAALFAFAVFNNLTQPKTSDTASNTNLSIVKVAATTIDTSKNSNLGVKLLESTTDDATNIESPKLVAKTDNKKQTTTPEEKQIENSDWLLKQNANQFTVQYASSTRQPLLKQDARAFPTDDPIVIYPFRRSKREKMVYGFAVGLYTTRADAEQAIAKIPDSASTNEPWIRQVGTLQKQITRTLAGE